MGLFLKQDIDQRSRLQEKVAAQLKERNQVTKDIKLDKIDPAFMDNQHTTHTGGILLVIAALVSIAVIAWIVAS